MRPSPHRQWLGSVCDRLRREPAVVRVMMAETRGSVPREPGACMLVGLDGAQGTIGGGQLEWDAIAAAQELLNAAVPAARFMTRVLGVDLGQCCGGVAGLWLDCFTASDLAWLSAAEASCGPTLLVSRLSPQGVQRQLAPASQQSGCACLLRDEGAVTFSERLDDDRPAVWLFGAGHVGQQLARMLSELPLQLTWVDSRPHQFPSGFSGGQLLYLERPQDAVAMAPEASYFVIMTHSHPLDYELCRAALLRGDSAWVGLIGSDSKAARFRSRLRRDGLSEQAIGRLVCPIGVDGINSKWPAAIAVSVAARLLQLFSLPASPAAYGDLPATRATAQSGSCDSSRCGDCGSEPVRPKVLLS